MEWCLLDCRLTIYHHPSHLFTISKEILLNMTQMRFFEDQLFLIEFQDLLMDTNGLVLMDWTI